MTPLAIHGAMGRGAVVLDMRLPRIFAKEHIPGAVNVQFNRADLVDRVEMVFPRETPFLVHAEPEAIARLAADLLKGAGFQVEGYLEGGLKAWKDARFPTARLEVLSVDDVRAASISFRSWMPVSRLSTGTATSRVLGCCRGRKRGRRRRRSPPIGRSR